MPPPPAGPEGSDPPRVRPPHRPLCRTPHFCIATAGARWCSGVASPPLDSRRPPPPSSNPHTLPISNPGRRGKDRGVRALLGYFRGIRVSHLGTYFGGQKTPNLQPFSRVSPRKTVKIHKGRAGKSQSVLKIFKLKIQTVCANANAHAATNA